MLQKFIQGYQAFRKKYAGSKLLVDLSDKGQAPDTMIITCADSRIDPSILLQCEPGDLFIVRNVAGIVPCPTDSAPCSVTSALEFAANNLSLRHLIIMGHSECVGIQCAQAKEHLQLKAVAKWLEQTKVSSDVCLEKAVKESLQYSYHNCLQVAGIKEQVQQGRLQVNLWFFEIKTGTIFSYDFASKKYMPLDMVPVELEPIDS